MIMNNTYLITIFVSSLSLLFNFILLKKLNNHIKHIIKNYIFYMLYFEFFKMTSNY